MSKSKWMAAPELKNGSHTPWGLKQKLKKYIMEPKNSCPNHEQINVIAM